MSRGIAILNVPLMDKQEERYYLELFLRLAPALTVSDIQETEAPDFLTMSGGISTGIELVRFIFEHPDGPSPAAIDNYRNQLAKKLREEHVARGIPPLHVSVHFAQDQALLSRQDRSDLVEHLLAFVSTNMPAENSSMEFDYFTLSPELTKLGLHALHLLRRKSLTIPFWGMPHASFVPESTADRVQALIGKKGPNVAAYRKRAKQLWLLIVSGTQGLQSILDLDGGLLEADYETDFDRIFLLRTFGGAVHELKRRPKIT